VSDRFAAISVGVWQLLSRSSAQAYFCDTRSPLRSSSAASRSTIRCRSNVFWNVRSAPAETAHPIFCPLRSALTCHDR